MCSSDLKKYGFEGHPVSSTKAESSNDGTASTNEAEEIGIRNLLEEMKQKAIEFVGKYEVIILELAKSILSKSSIKAEEIVALCEEHDLRHEPEVSKMRVFEGLLEKHGIEWEVPSEDA